MKTVYRALLQYELPLGKLQALTVLRTLTVRLRLRYHFNLPLAGRDGGS